MNVKIINTKQHESCCITASSKREARDKAIDAYPLTPASNVKLYKVINNSNLKRL